MEQYYQIKRIPAYWEKLDELVDNKRLIAPLEVYFEIAKPDDPYPWAHKHRKKKDLFISRFPDKYQSVKKIINECPGLIDPGHKGRVQADPYLIALVQYLSKQPKQKTLGASSPATSYAILTDEVPTGSPHKFKIPDACKKDGIPYYPMRKLIELENWTL